MTTTADDLRAAALAAVERLSAIAGYLEGRGDPADRWRAAGCIEARDRLYDALFPPAADA